MMGYHPKTQCLTGSFPETTTCLPRILSRNLDGQNALHKKFDNLFCQDFLFSATDQLETWCLSGLFLPDHIRDLKRGDGLELIKESEIMKFNKMLWVSLTFVIVQTMSAKNLTIVERMDRSNHELLDLECAGNIMMISGGLGGTAIFNLNDPLFSVQISSISIPEFEYNRAYNWEIKGQFAYGSGRATGMVVISLSSPSNPYIISYLGVSDPYSYEHLRANNTTLLVSAHSGGVLFYDITNHQEPEFLSQVTTENAWATALNGSLAYVAD